MRWTCGPSRQRRERGVDVRDDSTASKPMASPLTNRSVLITGGTGSFGQAFARHALEVGASKVVILSRDELKQSVMRAELVDQRLRFTVGDVRDAGRVALAARGCDYVVHAAAMKQIPACEDHPIECKRTNVDGTEAVAMAAIEAGVRRAVFLSTDKAAQPNTHYGACKLAAERLWTQANVYAAGTRTRLVATRYGNVFGSRGSVVPLWAKQSPGGHITITDPDMTRFWMPLSRSVWLVELALREGRGGEVFIPKLGSCTMQDMANALHPDVEHRLIGIRPGEKMHETLVAEDEARCTYCYGDHYRIEPARSWEDAPCRMSASAMPAGWSYRSDTNPWKLTPEEIRGMA